MTKRLRRVYRDTQGKCSACGRKLAAKETQHVGYDAAGVAVCVGNCCKKLVAETAARYAHMPPTYESPSDDAVLWRYTDFVKFTSLLATKSLYFTRGDRFEDPFEGAMGAAANRPKWDKHYREFFRDCVLHPPGGHVPPSEAHAEKEARRLLKEFKSHNRRAEHFITCWYESSHQSEAMWRLYSRDQSQGVAISTSARRLRLATGDDPEIIIGRVKYIDYDRQFAPLDESFFYKRLAFRHEQEVRAVLHKREDPPECGLVVPAKLDRLIESVHVSPFAPDWFLKTVQATMSAFGVRKKVKQSRLSKQPFH